MASTGSISKHYYSWEQIHATVLKSVAELQEKFNPTLLVGISGGGLIPSRMLRSGFKVQTGKTLPIQVVGAVHYDDDAGKVLSHVVRTQWLAPDAPLNGGRVLLVDEVDDSRKTLAFLVSEMLKYFDEAADAYTASKQPGDPEWVRPTLGVFVIHNKVRPKEASIDPGVYYLAGENTPNMWHVYPWDAPDITSHTAIAQAQEHYFREKPAELTAALDSSLPPSAAASALTHYADGGNTRAPALHDFHVVSKPVSALSAAISAAASSGGAAAAGADGQAQAGMPKVPSGMWRDEATGMYANMGLIPGGLAPRIGSLTLVDMDTSLSAAAAREGS